MTKNNAYKSVNTWQQYQRGQQSVGDEEPIYDPYYPHQNWRKTAREDSDLVLQAGDEAC